VTQKVLRGDAGRGQAGGPKGLQAFFFCSWVIQYTFKTEIITVILIPTIVNPAQYSQDTEEKKITRYIALTKHLIAGQANTIRKRVIETFFSNEVVKIANIVYRSKIAKGKNLKYCYAHF